MSKHALVEKSVAHARAGLHIANIVLQQNSACVGSPGRDRQAGKVQGQCIQVQEVPELAAAAAAELLLCPK